MKETSLPGIDNPKPNAALRLYLVNELRHLRMDDISFDAKNDITYLAVYSSVMTSIYADYPLLSGEVQRQMAKKIRRKDRKSSEQHER